MKVKLILAAPAAARSTFSRPIKYSLFPPLGLATLAAYLRDDDDVTLEDDNVESLNLMDAAGPHLRSDACVASDDPDLVGIEVYTAAANRAYEIADHYRKRGAHVALGGLHVTAMPEEASRHADTIFLGPGEDTWPVFLRDFRAGRAGKVYRSAVRTLAGQPPVRRDLIKRNLYLAANSLVVSRGCPHACDFCSNSTFFRGGKSFYTQTVDQALAEIERLPGRHLYFLDDHIFGDREFALALFEGMKGMGRIWQAAGTVLSALDGDLLDRAAQAGLRSLLVGFETLNRDNLLAQRKYQNLDSDYNAAIRRFHDAGVLINATFVFGLDEDDETVFERTVEWAIAQGIETATFHILTPYPGTGLYRRMAEAGRITSYDWDLYDTSHVVYRPARMTAEQLEAGYRRAYRDFYAWSAIARSAWTKDGWRERLRHVAYAGAWGKNQPLWNLAVLAKRVHVFSPLLVTLLDGFRGRMAPTPSHVGATGTEVGPCAPQLSSPSRQVSGATTA